MGRNGYENRPTNSTIKRSYTCNEAIGVECAKYAYDLVENQFTRRRKGNTLDVAQVGSHRPIALHPPISTNTLFSRLYEKKFSRLCGKKGTSVFIMFFEEELEEDLEVAFGHIKRWAERQEGCCVNRADKRCGRIWTDDRFNGVRVWRVCVNTASVRRGGLCKPCDKRQRGLGGGPHAGRLLTKLSMMKVDAYQARVTRNAKGRNKIEYEAHTSVNALRMQVQSRVFWIEIAIRRHVLDAFPIPYDVVQKIADESLSFVALHPLLYTRRLLFQYEIQPLASIDDLARRLRCYSFLMAHVGGEARKRLFLSKLLIRAKCLPNAPHSISCLHRVHPIVVRHNNGCWWCDSTRLILSEHAECGCLLASILADMKNGCNPCCFWSLMHD